jgi:hypothetical protein
MVVGAGEGPPPDACRWQDGLLRYLAQRRDLLVDRHDRPSRETRKLLRRLVDAIQRVEAFRTSRDPLVAGPPPEDEALREAWLRLRREKLQALEGELDGLLESIRRGHAPELEPFDWPSRLVTCLVACQRNFEERARLGERRAVNGDLARAQWSALLAAGDALGDLIRLNVQTAGAYPSPR